MNIPSPLVPLLVVRHAGRAIDFYVEALGAMIATRYQHGDHISHADLTIAGAAFAITEEARAWNSDAPPSLGGSPVVLQLGVEDAEAALTRLCAAGATVVFPLQELFGERMARVRDPFGHLWLVRQRVEQLSVEAIQRQRDELFASVTRTQGPATAAAQGLGESGTTLADSPATQQAANRPGAADQATAERRGRVHLVLGPVGAGKSTFALQLAREHDAQRFALDAWMARLFRPDRPDAGVLAWYAERAARCVEQIWAVAEDALGLGVDVVLELGLLQRREREAFYERIAETGCDLTIYVLDAPRAVRRERVEERNHVQGETFSMIVPPAIFELASDLWEPLAPLECEGRDVRFFGAGAGAGAS